MMDTCFVVMPFGVKPRNDGSGKEHDFDKIYRVLIKRAIEQAGVHAFWTGPVIFGASTLLFLPLMLMRYRQFAAHWHHTLFPGVLAGGAFALYIASLNLTDVVRAILLFYMSPLWSTLLGVVVLKERLTGNRVLGLLLAFTGLYIVLVVESGLPIPLFPSRDEMIGATTKRAFHV